MHSCFNRLIDSLLLCRYRTLMTTILAQKHKLLGQNSTVQTVMCPASFTVFRTVGSYFCDGLRILFYFWSAQCWSLYWTGLDQNIVPLLGLTLPLGGPASSLHCLWSHQRKNCACLNLIRLNQPTDLPVSTFTNVIAQNI